jgi:formylglycine-generating enzyme required for sulfatase activity
MERLMRALQNRAQTLLIDLSALNFRLELVRVPAGEFLMGSNLNLFKFAEDNEKPQHRVYLNEYFIGRYPVTVAQFAVFVAETCYRTEAERDGYEVVWQHPHDKSSYVHSKQHPVVCVTWNDAIAFCEWLSRQTGHVVSLPTEAEWEKAARWDATKQKARIWPWGNTFDKSKTNTNESRVRDTTPVGVYSAKGGDSLYGCADMAGNIWEWCADWYDGNEYKKRANMVLRNPSGPAAGDYRVLRGGSYFYHGSVARCACRLVDRPNYGVGLIGLNGFRVVVRSHSLASGL